MTATKTDNANLAAKLDLRRYFMRRYHANGTARVLDCCSGGGLIWRALRAEYPVTSYTALDVKREKGRLKIDSSRFLSVPGWDFDCIDIDTYGNPWKHWFAVMENMGTAATVFLTIGRGGPNRVKISNAALTCMGITMPTVLHKMSGAITCNLADLAVQYCLTDRVGNGIVIEEAQEAVAGGNARYIGVRIRRE